MKKGNLAWLIGPSCMAAHEYSCGLIGKYVGCFGMLGGNETVVKCGADDDDDTTGSEIGVDDEGQ